MKEVKLNKRIKIDSFRKLKKVLKGATPEIIWVTPMQWQEYRNLFPYSWDGYNLIRIEPAMTYNSAKLLIHQEYFKGFDNLPEPLNKRSI